jgi:indolepyruvate ferredoxin oxidoreductase
LPATTRKTDNPKFLRGSAFDIFGQTEERRGERALIKEYRACIEELLETLDSSKLSMALDIACIPQTIRGYGHVKERNLQAAKIRWEMLMIQWRSGRVPTKSTNFS